MMQFRLWLARLILGKHCACYRMGYHSLSDYSQQQIGKKNNQCEH